MKKNELLLAIDPGPTHSGWCMLDCTAYPPAVVQHGKAPNAELRSRHSAWERAPAVAVLERIASYGKPVGQEVFETAVQFGRIWEALERDGVEIRALTRPEVKARVCGAIRGVTDAIVRRRVIDIYGGQAAGVGTKHAPGPLYGVAADAWQAVALGLAWEIERRGRTGIL